jgi:hypothetical protein
MIDRVAQNEICPTSAAGALALRWCRAAAIALIAGITLVACGGPVTGPEEGLRLWVEQGQTAADEKDRSAILDMISPSYVDGRGNTRDDIGNILRAYFFRMHDVALITRIEDLKIIGETAAELVLTVAMAGTHEGTLGFSADAYRFEMELELDGDHWLLLGARWGELGGEIH